VSAIETRQAILERFEAWLDSALAEEAPPAGIDAEILAAAGSAGPPGDIPPAGAYQVWSALTALTQEVKLQGRAFQDLSQSVERQPAALAALAGEAAREREREIETRTRRETERRCWKEALGILIDLEDRLSRGLESTQAARKAGGAPRSFLDRLFARPDRSAEEVTAAVVRGYELALERLAHAFEQVNAHPIQSLGEPFDPRTMNAIDRQETSGAPEGSVLEVYRRGYEWNGEVLRTAQVKVACAPKEAKDDE
jgi:molecular chaperone GrpE